MKTKLEKAIFDTMSKNPNNWKGIFYFNPNVEKTVNWPPNRKLKRPPNRG